MEYIIWGIAPNTKHEQVLLDGTHVKIESLDQAKRLIRHLENVHNCTKCRVQELDLSTPPNFINTIKK